MMNAAKVKRKMVPYIYIIPAILFMFIFVMIPIILSVVMSFFKVISVSAEWELVGFSNFIGAFKNNEFVMALLRTLMFGAFSTVTGLIFGLLLAVMVSGHKWLNFYRYIFYVPAVVSAVTMGRLWGLMLMPSDSGMLNKLLMSVFGLKDAVNWLGNPDITYLVIMAIGLIGCGGGMTLVLFSTAINNIPADLKEAARLEGTGAWQFAIKITIPMISPVIVSWLILSLIGAFKSFEFIFSMTGGGPAGSTQTIAILLYQSSKGSAGGYGYSAAMGLILTLIVSAVTLTYTFLSGFNKSSSVEN